MGLGQVLLHPPVLSGSDAHLVERRVTAISNDLHLIAFVASFDSHACNKLLRVHLANLDAHSPSRSYGLDGRHKRPATSRSLPPILPFFQRGVRIKIGAPQIMQKLGF